MSIAQYIKTQYRETFDGMNPQEIAAILNLHFACQIPAVVNVAAVVGLQGENAFESMMAKSLASDYKVENKAKTSRTGDFIISWKSIKTNRTYRMLVDVKNYKTTVPTKELEKFYRDILHTNVDCGLLLSLNSHIVGHRKSIEPKYLSGENNNKIPIVLMCSHMPEPITEIIITIFHICEITNLQTCKIEFMDEFVASVSNLDADINSITDCKETLVEAKTEIDTQLNKVLLKLMKCEYTLSANIRRIRATMSNYDCMEEKLSVDELSFAESSNDPVKTVVELMKLSEQNEIILREVIGLYGKYKINLSKKIIVFDSVSVKCGATLSIIYKEVSQAAIEYLSMLDKKIYRNTSAGCVIKLDGNMEHVKKIHMLV